MPEVLIPHISDNEILKRYKQIKPVVTLDEKLYYLRRFNLKEIRGICFLSDCRNDAANAVGKNELTVLEGKDFNCLHTYGLHGLFRPTIAEVLAQINDNDIPLVKAFEIIETPNTRRNAFDNDFISAAFTNGYHVSIVRLYG